MKNLINYYYGLILNDFRKISDTFNFTVDGIKYSFVLFEGDGRELYDIYVLLRRNNLYCHEPVINNQNSIVTIYDGKPYVLLKKTISINRKITIDDIVKYSIPVSNKHDLNWKKLWENKIDYYEYQMSQFGIKYKCLKNSLNYYIGLSENAISILNYVDFNSKTNIGYICHRRIMEKETLDEFYNPINIIIDVKLRDIAEYFKANYIDGNITLDEVLRYIDKINLDYNDSLIFLSRMLYPSYYFDLYDKIIQGTIHEEKINNCIKKNVQFETFLVSIYKQINLRYRNIEVEWLS